MAYFIVSTRSAIRSVDVMPENRWENGAFVPSGKSKIWVRTNAGPSFAMNQAEARALAERLVRAADAADAGAPYDSPMPENLDEV